MTQNTSLSPLHSSSSSSSSSTTSDRGSSTAVASLSVCVRSGRRTAHHALEKDDLFFVPLPRRADRVASRYSCASSLSMSNRSCASSSPTNADDELPMPTRTTAMCAHCSSLHQTALRRANVVVFRARTLSWGALIEEATRATALRLCFLITVSNLGEEGVAQVWANRVMRWWVNLIGLVDLQTYLGARRYPRRGKLFRWCREERQRIDRN